MSTDPLDHYKAQFHRSADAVHINNSGQAPMSRPALDAAAKCLEAFYLDGSLSYPPVSLVVEQSRVDLAKFIGCKTRELGFMQSAAATISQVALGFPLKAGDEVIIWDQEYPSNYYPWLRATERAGAKLVVAKSDSNLATPIETLQKLITDRTKVIAVSWVQYLNGAMTDLSALAKLARPLGIFTCVDIIQGVGCLPFNFHALGIDAACSGSHKWMAAGHTVGFLALREEHLEKIEPLMYGAITYGTPDTPLDHHLRPNPDARRFEPGSLPFPAICALGAAARLAMDTGIDRIAQEAEWLAKKLMHGLRERGYMLNSPHGAQFRGAIVNFAPTPEARYSTLEAVESCLLSKKMAFARRRVGIRLSPHALNTAEEIDRVLEALSI